MNFMLTIIGSAIGYFVASYISSLLFVITKADKCENMLADKVADKVVSKLRDANYINPWLNDENEDDFI